MFNTNPIASGIRLGKIESIDTAILTGRADGMIALNESVRQLWEDGRISMDVANRFNGEGTFGRRK